jgi:hypothetical protein
MTRRTNGATDAVSQPVPQPEVADDPAVIEQTEKGLVCASPEQLSTERVPASGRAGKEGSRARMALSQHAFETPRVLRRYCRAVEFLANEEPKPGRSVVESTLDSVQAAGALRPRRHPAIVHQYLEMPGDRALRQLEDGAQLRNRELVAFEQCHESAARCIRQSGEAVENRGRSGHYHPYIRMER